MQARFLFSEVGSGLRRNVSMAVSVVLVTMVSMLGARLDTGWRAGP